MASEDQDILAKISQLAGQINRHKSGQSSEHQTRPMTLARNNSYSNLPQTSTGWRPSRGGPSSRGYRGGRPAAGHRNRTLVLNSNSPTPPASDTAEVASNEISENLGSTSNTPSWVTKKDRHLQLINTSIFEKESQNRAKAMEQTRKQKAVERDTREKTKLARHLQRLSANVIGAGAPQSRPVTGPGNYEINVQGIQFRVAKNGSKLVKVPGEMPSKSAAYAQSKLHPSELGLLPLGDLNAAKSTPKAALVGGVPVLKAPGAGTFMIPQRLLYAKNFFSKGHVQVESPVTFRMSLLPKEHQPACILPRGIVPSQIAATYMFVFLRMRWSAGLSEYTDIVRKGQVVKSAMSTNALTSAIQASVMRSHTNRGDVSAEDESSDLSSDDEDEEIDSDDVDSDDLDEEYFGHDDGAPDIESMRKDYVQLS
ncbi:uncharacterized protein BP5553_02864 [Venustampulla echinocandica]|uniref:Uncharacterized protein n=1 Tax=Venustampulla echinocandica TaxID=2656787 RepID=A0A370TSQ0_9HELO|nr:uncharacterized protein BP5553_02864 [Venustampulla echinocandica]RDL38524.1 hypothetical protein BP5553_02864 [Venustampulla echinocandica]